MEIERIEDWVGADVVDPAGEKVGKLEDLYYASGYDDPVAASVKTGTIGKSLTLVPLDKASVTRSYLRVNHAKETFKAAPDVQAVTDLATSTVTDASEHFGVALPGGELESGARRKQVAEAAAAAQPEA
jgi:PRC-barrel domain protein